MSIIEIENKKDNIIEEEKLLEAEISELSINTLIKVKLDEEQKKKSCELRLKLINKKINNSQTSINDRLMENSKKIKRDEERESQEFLLLIEDIKKELPKEETNGLIKRRSFSNNCKKKIVDLSKRYTTTKVAEALKINSNQITN